MAVTFDFGTCAACGENNSKTLQACRACGAALPWAKTGKNAPAPVRNNVVRGSVPSYSSAPKGVSGNASPPPFQNSLMPPSAPPKTKIGLGDIAYGAIAVQILGGIVFVAGAFFWCGNVFGFHPTFPGVGYITMAIGGAIWRGGLAID